MIKTVCPHCDTPLKGPDTYVGKHPRCPRCKGVAPAPAAGAALASGRTASPGPQPSEDPLLEELLMEAQGGGQEEDVPLKEKSEPVLRPKPKSSQKPTIIAVAVILLLTLGGVLWTVRHIRSNLALSNARRQADRVARNEPDLLASLEIAEAALERGEYSAAERAYRGALSTAEGLMGDVRSALGGVEIASAREPLEQAEGRIAGYLERIRTALESDEIQKGAAGMVLFEGQWVTPEERERLFRERMAGQGRAYYDEFDQWMTEEEYHMAKGHVKYKDKWMTPAQKERIQAVEEEEQRASQERAEARAQRLAEEQRRQREREQAAQRAARSPYPPEEARWVISDFEDTDEIQWQAQTWGNPVALSITRHRGASRLQMAVEMGPEDKAAIARRVRLDLSDRHAIEMDVDNQTGAQLSLAIALDTTEFFESRQVRVKPGFNTGVKFPLDVGDFKARSTGWRHNARPEGLDNTRMIYLLLYTRQAGVYYFDNIAAVKAR